MLNENTIPMTRRGRGGHKLGRPAATAVTSGKWAINDIESVVGFLASKGYALTVTPFNINVVDFTESPFKALVDALNYAERQA